jgi:hypothetical protein
MAKAASAIAPSGTKNRRELSGTLPSDEKISVNELISGSKVISFRFLS